LIGFRKGLEGRGWIYLGRSPENGRRWWRGEARLFLFRSKFGGAARDGDGGVFLLPASASLRDGSWAQWVH